MARGRRPRHVTRVGVSDAYGRIYAPDCRCLVLSGTQANPTTPDPGYGRILFCFGCSESDGRVPPPSYRCLVVSGRQPNPTTRDPDDDRILFCFGVGRLEL